MPAWTMTPCALSRLLALALVIPWLAVLSPAVLSPAVLSLAWAQTQPTAVDLFDRIRSGDRAAATALRSAAEAGNAESQFQLGRAYSHGAPNLPRDDHEAARWVEKAAQQGHVEAQTNLGYLHAAGIGVARDGGKALTWWIKAAEAGYAPAQFNLALAFQQGNLLPRDEAQAFFWMSRAAAQGLPDAQLNLGIMFGRGSGTAPDPRQALDWYRKAAEQGSDNAMTNLGSMYAYGEGVAKNPAEALRWLRKPVADGSRRAVAIRDDVCKEHAALCEAERAPAHFMFDIPDPRLRITIPDAPPMPMGPHPLAATQPNARFMGSTPGGYTLSVLTPAANAGTTPKECANLLGEAVLRRFAVTPDEVVTRQIDELTFVLLFAYKAAPPVLQYKAFLLSGDGASRCVEVHLSRTASDDSGLADWMKGFAGVRVEKY